MKKIASFLLLFCFIGQSAFADFEQGKDYRKVDEQATSTGDKIEVLEFFWYGCPHCNTFEPFVQNWKHRLLTS